MSKEIKIPLVLTFADIYDLIHVYYFSEVRVRKALRKAIGERHPKALAVLEDTKKLLVKELNRYGKLAKQKIFKECDHKILARALVKSEELQAMVFPNVSRRTGLVLKEDMESIRQLVDLEDPFFTQEAQVNLLEVIRDLHEKGEVIPEDEVL